MFKEKCTELNLNLHSFYSLLRIVLVHLSLYLSKIVQLNDVYLLISTLRLYSFETKFSNR